MFKSAHRFVGVLTLGRVWAAVVARAEVKPFPSGFKAEQNDNRSAKLHVRVGAQKPAEVLTHGFGDTGAMWEPLAAERACDHAAVNVAGFVCGGDQRKLTIGS
jgi:hypothetical protein